MVALYHLYLFGVVVLAISLFGVVTPSSFLFNVFFFANFVFSLFLSIPIFNTSLFFPAPYFLRNCFPSLLMFSSFVLAPQPTFGRGAALSLPPLGRHLGSCCLFAPLYAHVLIALTLLFSLCVKARTSSEESPPKTATDWYRGNGSGPRRVQTITRTSRKSTSENGMDLCMLSHYRRKCSNSECRFPASPP